jgi:hypothetical protein
LTSAGGEEVLPAVLLALVDDAALLLAGGVAWLLPLDPHAVTKTRHMRIEMSVAMILMLFFILFISLLFFNYDMMFIAFRFFRR